MEDLCAGNEKHWVVVSWQKMIGGFQAPWKKHSWNCSRIGDGNGDFPAFVESGTSPKSESQGSSQGDCDVFYCDSAASWLPVTMVGWSSWSWQCVACCLASWQHKDPSCECLLVGFRNCSSTNRQDTPLIPTGDTRTSWIFQRENITTKRFRNPMV